MDPLPPHLRCILMSRALEAISSVSGNAATNTMTNTCGKTKTNTDKEKETFQKLLSGFFLLTGVPPHNGRTVAPEAILFESPCRAHPET